MPLANFDWLYRGRTAQASNRKRVGFQGQNSKLLWHGPGSCLSRTAPHTPEIRSRPGAYIRAGGQPNGIAVRNWLPRFARVAI